MIRLDFQRLSHACFGTEARFVKSLSTELLERGPIMPDEIVAQLDALQKTETCMLRDLSKVLINLCRVSEQKIVLLIDEVDSSTNNQVFLDFLALLRIFAAIERDIQKPGRPEAYRVFYVYQNSPISHSLKVHPALETEPLAAKIASTLSLRSNNTQPPLCSSIRTSCSRKAANNGERNA